MFVTTIVVGVVAVTVPYQVTRRPFIRDVVLYLTAVTWVRCLGAVAAAEGTFLTLPPRQTYVILWDNIVHLWEAIGEFVVLGFGL